MWVSRNSTSASMRSSSGRVLRDLRDARELLFDGGCELLGCLAAVSPRARRRRHAGPRCRPRTSRTARVVLVATSSLMSNESSSRSAWWLLPGRSVSEGDAHEEHADPRDDGEDAGAAGSRPAAERDQAETEAEGEPGHGRQLDPRRGEGVGRLVVALVGIRALPTLVDERGRGVRVGGPEPLLELRFADAELPGERREHLLDDLPAGGLEVVPVGRDARQAGFAEGGRGVLDERLAVARLREAGQGEQPDHDREPHHDRGNRGDAPHA